MTLQRFLTRQGGLCLRALALLCGSLLLCGCINVLPLPRVGEQAEAKEFGKTIRDVMPESERQLILEHTTAQKLRITLDEAATLPTQSFRDRFNGYIDQLIAVRSKRRDLRQRFKEKSWNSPMVFNVQANCVREIDEQIVRDQQWIEWALGVRLRVEMGQQKDFPELQLLQHSLDNFLSLPVMDPLSTQLRALLDEFRLSDAQIGQ